jgi:predicted PurR-regulated permease PerM/serine phosphatase RsbU (regulator of sigma subunit)
MPRSSTTTASPRSTALLGTMVAVAVLYLARDVLITIATAVLLTFVLAPVTRKLQRWGLGRVPSAFLVVFLMLVLGAGVAWVVGHQLFELTSNLPQYRANIHEKIASIQKSGSTMLGRAGRSLQELKDLASTTGAGRTSPTPAPVVPKAPPPVPVTVVEPPPGALVILRSMAGPLLAPLMNVGIVLMFLTFMLIQREDLRDRVIRLVGQGQLSVTTQAIDDAARRVSRYLMMQCAINAGFGLAVAIGLLMLGVPTALLWGALAGLLRFIPFLGPWLGALMPITVSIAVNPGWSTPLATIGMFAVLELLTNNVAEPFLYGSGTGLSTLAVVVSAVFWAWLWGAAGLILATPLTTCLVVVSRYVPQMEFLGVLLGDERALEPDAHLYQRLLAMDEVEASEIVDGHLHEHTVIEVYDRVLLPALNLAELDRHRGGLTEDKQEFIMQTLREMVDDLDGKTAEPETLLNGRVVCLPARDEADEIACRMLVQQLEALGVTAQAVSTQLLSGEMLETIAREKPDAICISAMPPYAVMYATYLCKRVRRRFPDTPVVMGLWSPHSEASKAYRRLQGVCGDRVATSLAGAIERMRTLLPAEGDCAVEPPVAVDEDARLREVEALQLLDTEPEPAFDRILESVTTALEMPLGFIALVDGRREWWKAHRGWPAEHAAARGVARSGSLGAHVVGAGGTLVVPDLRRDPRFAGNALARAAKARSFAGVPLRAAGGQAVGVLAVLDVKARRLSDAEVRLLELVAGGVMAEARLRVAVESVESLRAGAGGHAASETNAAGRTLQRKLLPQASLQSGPCRVVFRHRASADGVTAFLDAVEGAGGRLVVLVADMVAPERTGSALAAVMSTSFRRVAEQADSAGAVLKAVEQDVARVAEPDTRLSVTVALVWPEERRVELAVAGHEGPIILREGGAESPELSRAQPLLAAGGGGGEVSTITLEPGERLLIAGEGATEAESADGALLGRKGVTRLAAAASASTAEEVLEAVERGVEQHAGEPRLDLALVVVEAA